MATCENCGLGFERKRGSVARACSRSCSNALSWKDPEKAEKRRQSITRARQTLASRARSTDVNNRRWAKPGEREKLSESNRKMWAEPKTRAKLSKAIRKAQRAPEQRAFYSRMRTAQWADDPEYRRKVVEGMRRHHGTPEARAKFSALLTERWNDPAVRAKMTAANQRKNRDEKNRAAMSERMLKRWATDVSFRIAVTESLRLYHSSPEAAEIKSARMKALWADPVWKMRQRTLVAEGMSGLGTAIAAGNIKAASSRSLNDATDLIAAVDRLIPSGLPDFIKTDVCQDVMVALFEGSLKICNLAQGVKSHLTQYRKMFPDKFGPVSIDAPIPGTDGLTMADTLSNETPHF